MLMENEVICGGSAECFTGEVTNIVDGDTIDIGDIRIRLSLTNTPELDEGGYKAAKDFTSDLCPVGSRALVDQDDIQLVDVYGRMLAKVTCGDNNLNAELIYNGYAGILTEYCAESEFSIEDWAQEYGCGVTEEPAPTEDEAEDKNCDPSYPTVCIPPPPPDLDCGDISYRDFEVLEPDPHRFDGDNDGIGCES